jgi:riboflavin biosynthesis pyrimidine reductase
LDRHGVLSKDCRIFSDEAPTIVYRENTDWQYILSDLAQRNIHSVLVEGGAMLLQHILDSGVYDEIHVEVSKHSLPQVEGQISGGVRAPKYEFLTSPTIIDGNKIYVEYR